MKNNKVMSKVMLPAQNASHPAEEGLDDDDE